MAQVQNSLFSKRVHCKVCKHNVDIFVDDKHYALYDEGEICICPNCLFNDAKPIRCMYCNFGVPGLTKCDTSSCDKYICNICLSDMEYPFTCIDCKPCGVEVIKALESRAANEELVPPSQNFKKYKFTASSKIVLPKPKPTQPLIPIIPHTQIVSQLEKQVDVVEESAMDIDIQELFQEKPFVQTMRRCFLNSRSIYVYKDSNGKNYVSTIGCASLLKVFGIKGLSDIKIDISDLCCDKSKIGLTIKQSAKLVVPIENLQTFIVDVCGKSPDRAAVLVEHFKASFDLAVDEEVTKSSYIARKSSKRNREKVEKVEEVEEEYEEVDVEVIEDQEEDEDEEIDTTKKPKTDEVAESLKELKDQISLLKQQLTQQLTQQQIELRNETTSSIRSLTTAFENHNNDFKLLKASYFEIYKSSDEYKVELERIRNDLEKQEQERIDALRFNMELELQTFRDNTKREIEEEKDKTIKAMLDHFSNFKP